MNYDDKIKTIYKYILDKLYYYRWDFNFHKEIFSWLSSYKNWYWVCDWYTKLFWYMLFFSWIENFEIKKWYVINSSDFPNVWHAWLKIDNFYYDPTFDDPIWINKNKTYSDFLYYKLPKEIIYTSRFDWFNIPDEYKWKSYDYLNLLVDSRLYNLSWKINWYKILNYYKVLKEVWFKVDNITINNLCNFNTCYNVDNKTYNYKDEFWKNIKIKWLKYYNISNNKELKNIIKQLWFDFLNMKYFIWHFEDWSKVLRLGYDIQY